MCLLIHQGGEGQLLSQTLGPRSYPFPAVQQEGRTPLNMHGDQFSLKFSKLYSSHLKYSWPVAVWPVYAFVWTCHTERKKWMGAGLKGWGRRELLTLTHSCWQLQHLMLCYQTCTFSRLLGIHRQSLAKWEIIRVYWAMRVWKWTHRAGLLLYFTVYPSVRAEG